MFTDDRSRFSSSVVAAGNEMNSDNEPETAPSNPLDDVFGDDSGDEPNVRSQLTDTSPTTGNRNDVSDVPRLRGIHTTNGYRDGISASKEKFLQEGFDEGYSLGAEIGAVAGRLFGILEALVAAMQEPDAQAEAKKTLEEARAGLSAKALYATEYFGEDGIWKYEVTEAGGSEDDVTFRMVASKHPVMAKWNNKVDALLAAHGLKTSS